MGNTESPHSRCLFTKAHLFLVSLLACHLLVHKLAFYVEVGIPKKDHSRCIGGRFNKQGNLLPTRLVLSSCNRSWSHKLTKILKEYLESSTGFDYICHPNSLNNTLLSQSCVHGQFQISGRQAEFIFKVSRGAKSLQLPRLPRPSLSVNQWSYPLDGLLQQKSAKFQLCKMNSFG